MNKIIFWPIIFLAILMMGGAFWFFEVPTYVVVIMVGATLAILIAAFLKGRREGQDSPTPWEVPIKKL
ncbi:MAG: hypothetical protein WCT25_01185 [Candidatus Paceibacterota bacterium]